MIILAIILTSYFIFLALLISGWNRAGRITLPKIPHDDLKISVVVAVRNEAKNIRGLLDSLLQQDYRNTEIIIVNDHSTDNTKQILDLAMQTNPAGNIRWLGSNGHGKKTSLKTGIQQATGEIIVTTDADSTAPKEWLTRIAENYRDKNIKMVCGAVRISPDKSLFADLQAIEFSSLIGSGAATLALGYPTMCNGANLSFLKKTFEEVGGYEDNLEVASGDDEFLMRKIFAKYPHGVRFLRDAGSVVSTTPAETVTAFFQQRIRWAGKWRFNSSWVTRLAAVYVVAVQVAVLACFYFLLTPGSVLPIILLSARFVMESYFLFNVCKFLGVRWSWPGFVILQAVYPVYVLLTGVSSQFMPYSWKGRRMSQSVS